MKTIDYYTNEERAEAPARKEYTPIRRFYAIVGFSFLLAVLSSLIINAII
jgi:hypothetical protein